MLLSDFGEARIGPGPHRGDIMPLKYRAPEALLHVGWSYPVDIWSVGLTVSLLIFEYTSPPTPLFFQIDAKAILSEGVGSPWAEKTIHSSRRRRRCL